MRNTGQSEDPTRLTKQRTNTNIRKKNFSQRLIKEWNQIPNNIRGSLNVNIKTFKLKLEEYLTSSEWNPRHQ